MLPVASFNFQYPTSPSVSFGGHPAALASEHG
jgi:hypothetical protein